MSDTSVLHYFGRVHAKIISSHLASEINIRPVVNERDKYRGAIVGDLSFTGGGALQVAEEIRINPINDEIEMTMYSYTYTGTYKDDPNFFFRYDKDTEASLNQDGSKRINHPEHHLHANDNDLRYMTHQTSLIEVFNFVAACFFDRDLD